MATREDDPGTPRPEEGVPARPASPTTPERDEGVRSASTPSEEFTDEPVVSDASDDPSDSG